MKKPRTRGTQVKSMTEYENITLGETDEWYTPSSVFDALNTTFDLDPCSPGANHWVPAKHVFMKEDDGLSQDWFGFVFMNPPFGGRNGHIPWLHKFLAHSHGIAMVRAYTSAAWFHETVVEADGVLFPLGKTKFIRPDGSIGKSPGSGSVLIAMGYGCKVLRKSGLGWYIDNNRGRKRDDDK